MNGARDVDVCVVGSSNLDLVAATRSLPRPGETVLGHRYAEHPGGKGLNQAVACARSGAATAFVSSVGHDPAGERLLSVMVDEGIDVDHVAQVDRPTGRALIVVDDRGENSIVVVPGANATVAVDGIPRAAVVLCQLEIPLVSVASALRAGRQMGAITVLNPAPAAQLDDELLGLCDVVVPNEHELEVLGGAEALQARGASTVIVTQGAAGVTIHRAGTRRQLPAFAVTAVDTTAAGDSFCGALCARLAAGDVLDDAVRYAAAAGALATTSLGAVPSIPRTAAVQALLNRA